MEQARSRGARGGCRPVRPGGLGYEKKWSYLGAGKGLGTAFLSLGLLSALGPEGGPPTSLDVRRSLGLGSRLGGLGGPTLPLRTSFPK